MLKLFDDDEFIDWLLTLIFKGFQVDVSYMSDEEYEACMTDTFNKLEYRNIPKEKLTGEKSILEISFRKSLEFTIHILLTITSSMYVNRNFMEGIWTIGTS